MTRRLRRVAGVALTSIAVGAIAVTLWSEARLRHRIALPAGALEIDASRASVARGRHLVRDIAQCGLCHGPNLAGANLVDDLWIGRLDAPNLTPGVGGIATTANATLVKAIRFGVGEEGRSLLMMPSNHYRRLSDADLASIIAYLRTQPPIDGHARPTRVGPFTRIVLAVGSAPELLAGQRVAARRGPESPPAPGPTAEYGAHLAAIAGCELCHGADLRGGLHPLALPGEPPPPDLTPSGATAGWTQEDFVRVLRTGRTPDGRRLNDTYMPWRAASRMHDDELQAIWRYLRSIPPVTPVGGA